MYFNFLTEFKICNLFLKAKNVLKCFITFMYLIHWALNKVLIITNVLLHVQSLSDIKKKTFVGKWNVPISTYCHISRDHFLDNRTGQYSQKNHSRKSFNEKWKVKARGIIQIGQAWIGQGSLNAVFVIVW